LASARAAIMVVHISVVARQNKELSVSANFITRIALMYYKETFVAKAFIILQIKIGCQIAHNAYLIAVVIGIC